MKLQYRLHLSRRNLKSLSCVVLLGLLLSSILWYRFKALYGRSAVEGWEGVSRNTSDYVSESLPPHIMPKNFCQEEKILVVVVCSRPDGFEIRRAIRDTWGQKHNNASVFFLVGEVDDDVVQAMLEVESNQFGDVIQERFVDTYNNLTLKSVNMLKLFKTHCAATHKYLLKADDDLFVDLNATVEHLGNRGSDHHTFLGKVRSKISPYRRPNSKWYMPYEWFPGDMYPDFLCGPAYVMSVDVAEKIYRCALAVPLIHTEDVYLTGICAQRMRIVQTTSSKFTCNRHESNICDDGKVWTLHYLTADDIRETYDILKNNRCEQLRSYNVLNELIFFLRPF